MNNKSSKNTTKKRAAITDVQCPDPPFASLTSLDVMPKPNHSLATGIILVDGLSMLGFDGSGTAHVGFFIHDHNPVEVKVFRTVSVSPPECELFWSSEDVLPNQKINNIDIKNSAAGGGKPCERYLNAPPQDFEDFSYMPYLPYWHGVTKMDVKPDSQNHHISARMTVKDAIFYTHKMIAGNRTIKRGELQGSILVNKQIIQNVGRIPGADIICPIQNLEIKIKTNTSTVTVPLPATGAPFTILVRSAFRNNTHHLKHVYNVIKRAGSDTRVFGLEVEPAEDLFSVCDEQVFEATQFECQSFVGGCGGW